MLAILLQIIIASTLRTMNKTDFFLDLQIRKTLTTVERRWDSQLLNFSVSPYEITPSMMFESNNRLSVALRFTTSNGNWSDRTELKDVKEMKRNESCKVIDSKYKICHIPLNNVNFNLKFKQNLN